MCVPVGAWGASSKRKPDNHKSLASFWFNLTASSRFEPQVLLIPFKLKAWRIPGVFDGQFLNYAINERVNCLP
jgi:hypothetical protein